MDSSFWCSPALCLPKSLQGLGGLSQELGNQLLPLRILKTDSQLSCRQSLLEHQACLGLMAGPRWASHMLSQDGKQVLTDHWVSGEEAEEHGDRK